jgi:hypothetical protein
MFLRISQNKKRNLGNRLVPWTEFPCECELRLNSDEIYAFRMKRTLDCSLIGEDRGGDDEEFIEEFI